MIKKDLNKTCIIINIIWNPILLLNYLLLVVTSLQLVVGGVRRHGDWYRPLAAGAALVALAVIGLLDHFTWDLWFGMLLFWLVLGLAVRYGGERQNLWIRLRGGSG